MKHNPVCKGVTLPICLISGQLSDMFTGKKCGSDCDISIVSFIIGEEDGRTEIVMSASDVI